MEAPMRAHHVLAVAAMVAVGVGAKLVLSQPMKAEADIPPVASMNVLQMQIDHRNMAVQKIHDMTFVFAVGD
jgi:hypothetical protein